MQVNPIPGMDSSWAWKAGKVDAAKSACGGLFQIERAVRNDHV